MSKTITTGFVSATVNGITVKSSIPCNAGNYNNYESRNIAYVVMHYTGNAKDTAKANANYFATSGRGASAHFFVDDTEIYQSVELRDAAWHCGATTYKHASCRNGNSIGIEMCCTAGNYKISETTKTNAAYLCAYVCNLLGITAAQVDTYVLRHYDVTGKNCPAQMVSSASEWTAFKALVKSILSGTATASTTATASSEGNTTYCGTGIGTAVAKDLMNVRSTASTSGTIVGTVSVGVAVEVLQTLSSGWYKIVWPGASCGYAYTSNVGGNYYSYTANGTTTTSATSSTASYATGDKVTVNGNIYANGNGGNAVAKSNATMYVTEVLSSTKYKYYIGVATKKGGTRQGWANPDILSKA